MKIIRIILFLIFAAEGIMKLLGMQNEWFVERWGYSVTFAYVMGIIELLLAFGLLIPKTRLLANIGLLLVMVGAFYTHIKSDDPVSFMSLAIIASILLIVHLVKLLKRKPTI